MTQEEKQLLLKDLCVRLPYGVIADCVGERIKIKYVDPNIGMAYISNYNAATKWESIEVIKPYLRSLSSMTEEERSEYESFFSIGEYSCGGSLYGTEYEYIADSPDDISQSVCLFDWLNSHHFDYRGLIEKGLALESPEGMYNV